MKKLVVLATALVMTCGLGRIEAAGPPHAWDDHDVIGLIDMARVFKEYKKFEALREGLKTEISASEETIKSDVEALKALSAKLQMMTESSPGYAQAESELASKAAEVDARRKVMQRDFLRKESQIYKQVYLEVQTTVTQYAEYYGYHVVLRYNGTQLQETDDARGVINGMNRQVVYHRKKDDITDAVLQHLNTQYQKTVSAKDGSPKQ